MPAGREMLRRSFGFLVPAAAAGLVLLLLACGSTTPTPSSVIPLPETETPTQASTPDASSPETPAPTPSGVEAGETSRTPTPGEVEAPEPGLTPTPIELPVQIPTWLPGQITGEVPQDLLAAILADAEAQSGIRQEELTVVRSEAVVWSDGSLGCPQPGVMYTQALVPGYWVVLEYDDQTLDYRASDRGYFSLCEQSSLLKTVPPLGGASPTPQQ
jgi:hypothetical protein